MRAGRTLFSQHAISRALADKRGLGDGSELGSASGSCPVRARPKSAGCSRASLVRRADPVRMRRRRCEEQRPQPARAVRARLAEAKTGRSGRDGVARAIRTRPPTTPTRPPLDGELTETGRLRCEPCCFVGRKRRGRISRHRASRRRLPGATLRAAQESVCQLVSATGSRGLLLRGTVLAPNRIFRRGTVFVRVDARSAASVVIARAAPALRTPGSSAAKKASFRSN